MTEVSLQLSLFWGRPSLVVEAMLVLSSSLLSQASFFQSAFRSGFD